MREGFTPKEIYSNHINEFDAGYQEQLEKRQQRSSDHGVFGEEALGNIRDYRSKLEKLANDPTFNDIDKDNGKLAIEQKIDGEANSVRETLIQIASHPNSRMMFINFLIEACESSALQSQLNLSDKEREYTPIEQAFIIADKFESGEVSNDFFINALENHVSTYYEKREIFESKLPQLKEQFVQKVTEEIANGFLPITEDVLTQRMGETKVDFVDFMKTNFQENGGDYNPSTARIRVNSFAPIEELDHTYTHEAIHSLSGKTILKSSSTNQDVETFKNQRTGLSFHNDKFDWINEAVTEEIAIYLDGLESSDSYPSERNRLTELYKEGLSQQILYAAYFENFDPSAESGSKVEKWHELRDHLKQTNLQL